MTQPDRLIPDGTANKGSFAKFAAKTQEQWQEEQRGKTSASLNQAKAGFGKIGTDIRTIIANLARGWSGHNQTEWSLDDLFNTSWSQKQEIARIAAGQAQFEADQKANNNSGKSLVVKVAEYDTTMPSVFTKHHDLGVGEVYNDGNTLQFSNADGRELFRYNVEPLVTDYAEVSMVVPKQAGMTFGSYFNRSLFFIGRSDATMQNFCFARLNGNRLRVGCVLGGDVDSPIWFPSGATGTGPTDLPFSPGLYMTFACGSLAGARVFQFKVGNAVGATFVDTGNVALIGENYRWTGFGIRNDNDPLNQSPSMSLFAANDNAPAAVDGTGATLVRLATSSWNIANGMQPLGAGFWDATEEVSADMAGKVSVANGEVTIPESGWYTVHAQSRTGTAWPSHFQWVLYKNGLPYKHFGSDHMFGSNALGGTIIPDQVSGSWSGYLYKDDVIRLGYSASGSAPNGLRGTADGSQTYMTVKRDE